MADHGVGQAGMHLVEYLEKEKAKVFVADLYAGNMREVVRQHQVMAVEQEDIYDFDADIYAPCALGATVNDEIRHGYVLMDRSITYAPDFVINGGGLINVYHEYLGNYNRKRVMEQAEKIYDTCLNLFSFAEREGFRARTQE